VRQRHTVFVDVNNIFNRGSTALISMGGGDRSIAPSIENYLTDHLNKLRNNWFFTLRN
jgi:hypothetical protein